MKCGESSVATVSHLGDAPRARRLRITLDGFYKKLRVGVFDSILNPMRECNVAFFLFRALLDHCSHFTQGCRNALVGSEITGNRIGRLPTMYVRRAVLGDLHEIRGCPLVRRK